jgi:two-component system, NtrC family, sensor kinase
VGTAFASGGLGKERIERPVERKIMDADALYRRYQELQAYVGWTDEDARRVRSALEVVEPHLAALIDDFYAEIERHPEARKVITSGPAQIERLKGTLRGWVRELFAGRYDRDYVSRRWRVGWRHVEIGLDQVFTNVALSRLRRGLFLILESHWPAGSRAEVAALRVSLNTLLDLDLAMIEDAYQAEHAARLQRGERLAAIGQVAGGIAHELRNPLNVVKTSVYFLLNACNPSPVKTVEHLQRIERHVVAADRVISALTNFARTPLPTLNPVAVGPCLKEVLDVTPLPEAVAVEIDCPPSLPPVLADGDQLRIVFGNLIRNAGEAMPQGGRLILRACRRDEGVEVAVADTGAGIAPDDLHRILEPLYSTKARGLGLGLAIARAILDKNKGSLRAASEPGKGATFIVWLPAAGAGGQLS